MPLVYSSEHHTIAVEISFYLAGDPTRKVVLVEDWARLGLDELCNPQGSAATLLAKIPAVQELGALIFEATENVGVSCTGG